MWISYYSMRPPREDNPRESATLIISGVIINDNSRENGHKQIVRYQVGHGPLMHENLAQ